MKHTCTICGNINTWSKSWSTYGSILHEEIAPEDIIKVCSEKCKDELDLKLKTKEIQMTKILPRGYNDYRVAGKRFGY
ncbi:MAG: hypothetical protein GY870_22050 [archaeon]|nr:hypothetical protein [archaeon]